MGFFKCTVKCPHDLNIPVLPVKHNGKLTFPVGTFTGKWTSFELELAVKKGYAILPLEGYVFKTGHPLANYSKTLTSIKDQASIRGDAVTRNTAKLLLNTLYGKFARRYYQSSTSIVTEDQLQEIEQLYEVQSITHLDNGMIMVNYNNKPIANSPLPKDVVDRAFKNYNISTIDKNTNMAIAATITSHGRIILYNLYEEVIERGGKICYSDTDSVYAYLPESPFNKPFGPFI